jgi:hypothetical protein
VRRVVAAATAVLALALPAVADAARDVRVVVVPSLELQEYASRGAVGLLVPGAGSTVSRRGALAALERGKVRSALLGGVPSGDVLVRPSERPGEITFYVVLPPEGTSHNVRRYPIAVVGGGYGGLLTSTSTRIPGLVSVADVAPSVVALREGRTPSVRSEADADAVARVRRLDERLDDAHAARGWASSALIVLIACAALAALALRSPLLARTAVLVAPAGLAAAVLLSWAGVTRPAAVVPAFVLAAAGSALAGAAVAGSPRVLAALLLAIFPFLLVVLWARPEVNSLAVVGPHPDGGGRYHGITNQVETLLLVPALLGAALLGLRLLVPVAVLAIVTVGASRAGADGGGVVVLAAGFLVLGLRLAGVRLTAWRVAAIAVAAVLLAVALAGLDAATGGSSHVTDAVSGGPAGLVRDAAHRLDVSARGAVGSAGAVVSFVAGVVVLAWLGTRRPRSAVLDALLVALVVSLVVNDTPQDVVLGGALGGLGLWAWLRTADEPAPVGLHLPSRGYSSAGRAPGSHPGGRRFEPG